MYKSLPILLVAFAISTPAHADIFGFMSSNGGPTPVADGHVYAPSQTTIVGGGVTHGYPFYSGCCESKSPCAQRLWDGFCSGHGCGGSCCMPWSGRCGKGGCGSKGGCGISRSFGKGSSCGSCQKRGCGLKGGCAAGPCGYSSKSSWGHTSYRGLVGGKGGCAYGSACGTKGCKSIDPCGPSHRCRLGLFDWMHFGHGVKGGKGGKGHGCSMCGDVGCSSCGGGISTYGKGDVLAPAPIENNYYGKPTEAESTAPVQPPEVLVEPTSISDRSAWRTMAPANPFARPFGY